MLVLDLMLIALAIYTIVLLSGKKTMYSNKLLSIVVGLCAMSSIYISLSQGYKLGYINIMQIIFIIIILLLIMMIFYKINNNVYIIENVQEKDLINIIVNFLDKENIKHEVRLYDIYLTDLDKTITVTSTLSNRLNCKEISKEYFYKDLIKYIKIEIKKTKRQKISLLGLFNLIGFLLVYWLRITFLS